MTLFYRRSIREIETTRSNVFAFELTGEILATDSEDLAEYMNEQFDQSGEVNVLILFDGYLSSDWKALLDDEVLKARFRALKHVKNYAVVGAPEMACKMIGWMDKVIPIKARAFDQMEIDQAWRFVGARPTGQRAALAA